VTPGYELVLFLETNRPRGPARPSEEYSRVTEDTSHVDSRVGAVLGAPQFRFR
jgi:hypothetical protein